MAGRMDQTMSDERELVAPVRVINTQVISPGAYPSPHRNWFEMWGSELLLAGIYSLCGIVVLVLAIKKNQPIPPAIWGVVLLGVAVFVAAEGMKVGTTIAAMAVILLVLGIARLVHSSVRHKSNVTGDDGS